MDRMIAAALLLLVMAERADAEEKQPQDEEAQLGQEAFEELKAKAEMPQLLSDHPNDQNRIDAVQNHIGDNPSRFGKFSRDRQSATPFSAPKGAPVIFLH